MKVITPHAATNPFYHVSNPHANLPALSNPQVPTLGGSDYASYIQYMQNAGVYIYYNPDLDIWSGENWAFNTLWSTDEDTEDRQLPSYPTLGNKVLKMISQMITCKSGQCQKASDALPENTIKTMKK